MAYTKSNSTLSVLDFLVNDSVVSVNGDGLSSETTHSLNQLLEVIVCVAILELVVEVSHVVNIQFTLALGVQEGEVGSSSFLVVGVALK